MFLKELLNLQNLINISLYYNIEKTNNEMRILIKSLTIIGIISIILGVVLGIYLDIYYSMAAIFGFPMFIIGLFVRLGGKKPGSSGPETIYCSNCGSVLTKGTRFCPYCGKKL